MHSQSRIASQLFLQHAHHHKRYFVKLQTTAGKGFFIAEDVPSLGYARSGGTDRAFKERHCMDKLLVIAFRPGDPAGASISPLEHGGGASSP